MKIASIAGLLLLLLTALPGAQEGDPEPTSLLAQYQERYPFISMEDTVFTFESEFLVPEGYQYVDSSRLRPFANWVARFPLWHRWKSVGIWKGGIAFDREEISRVVHIPWRGPVYTDRGFPLRILAEWYRLKGREYDLTITPRLGDTLNYRNFLNHKVSFSGTGALKLVPATGRDSSSFEFYRFLNVGMEHQSYASIAANGDSISASEVQPGDLLAGWGKRGLEGDVYLIMNVLVNEQGDKLYAVATGCEEACDFHIPLVTLDRSNPWLNQDQLEKLVSSNPNWGYFRFATE